MCAQPSPTGPPEAYIQPWKLSHEKSEGWFTVRLFGTIICAFCSISLSCSAASTGDPALFLLLMLSQCSSAGTGCISKTLMKNKGMVGMSHCLFLWTIEVWFFFLDNKRKPQKEKNGHQPRNRVGENVYGCWQIYCAAFPCYKLHHCLQTRGRYPSAN